jgi:integrase
VRAGLRLPVTILAETGVRVGELLAWMWGDVDIVDCKIRVPRGKSAAAMRWVQIRPELMDDLLETCPPDDRAIDRRLFPGPGTLKARSAAPASTRVPRTTARTTSATGISRCCSSKGSRGRRLRRRSAIRTRTR